MMLSDVDDDMCLVYVLNELNFCHVFIRIACVSWVVNDVWDGGAFAQSDGGAFPQSDGEAY